MTWSSCPQCIHPLWRVQKVARHEVDPDVVALLTDGRILVVEYKGAIYYDAAADKRRIGELRAESSDGHCLFVMPKGRDFSVIDAAIKG